MKNTLILYHEYLEHFEYLSDEELGQLLRAIIRYDMDGEVPSFDNRAVQMAFSFIKTNLDIDREKYAERCKTNRRNGSKGGRKVDKEEVEASSEDGECEKETERFFEEPKKTERLKKEPFGTHNDNENDNENENDTDNDCMVKKTRARFIPPTAEEVAEYCRGRKNGIDPQRFVDHYTSNGWKVGRTKMQDWKAAVRTWEQNEFGDKQRPPDKPPRYDFDAFEKAARKGLAGKGVADG